VLLTIQNARFRRFVRPGDKLELRAELMGLVDGAGRCRCTAKVEGQPVASAELMLGYDNGQNSVIPEAARATLGAWAEQVNANLLAGVTIGEPGGKAS